MGWADCGTDDLGRPIGYAHAAVCDKPGCDVKIDRGLSYVCGSMHGGGEFGCGRYFCWPHLTHVKPREDHHEQLCSSCLKDYHAANEEPAR